MKIGYCITYSGSKQDGFTPVVSAPHIGEPLLYLSDEAGNLIRYDDPYQAEAHAGHYLCKALNESHRAATAPQTGGAIMNTKIWLLHVSHRHGDNYEAFTSFEAAQQELHSYVTEGWDDGLTEQYGDLNALTRDEAIDAYFDAHGNAIDPEYYALGPVTLRTGQP